MKIKNNKTLMITVMLFSYLQFSNVVNATPISNDVSKQVPEELQKKLPVDVAPELAEKGQLTVGVRTIEITNPAQFDPNTQTQKDRKLTLEVWYPSKVNKADVKTSYEDETRSGIPFSIQADAFRNSKVLKPSGDVKYPLVILSHGYTGYRSLMYYLAEHLASHGYIVAAIDHTDSTNAEVDLINTPFSGFFSTLLNRSRDQQFTLDYLTTTENFVSAAMNKNKAGLVGYSMGGYGAVNTIGGCYDFTDATTSIFTGIKDPVQIEKIKTLLNSCAGGQYKNAKVDSKWQAVIAMAPWGGQHNVFNTQALAKINTPVLYISGDLDDISDYTSIKSLYEKTGTQDKYLLTYKNARHNIAPHPAPSVAKTSELDIGHYYEPVWDHTVLNNNNKHFGLAMMDCYIKQQKDKCSYLDLSENSNQIPIDGKTPEAWKGFDHRYSTGMEWKKGK
ncbi:acetylhydrolase [Pseudocolwellia sp. AS88]|uniref:alpha/beta hydrolase family protein n=1 Tax=Pseudocolwellia sp. AS88 TaxID=3063958 RepID=UPI0026EFF06E|nr:acetylhydrolase [Pseudocolwellia sp. AS88]MDO7084785.1 acetylhydrolase [Pseudocolwellia sp. AS88]